MSRKRFYGFAAMEYVPRADKFEAYFEASAVAEPAALAQIMLDDMRNQEDQPLALFVGRNPKSGEHEVCGVARHIYRGWGK
jgi:hypothetical protein